MIVAGLYDYCNIYSKGIIFLASYLMTDRRLSLHCTGTFTIVKNQNQIADGIPAEKLKGTEIILK